MNRPTGTRPSGLISLPSGNLTSPVPSECFDFTWPFFCFGFTYSRGILRNSCEWCTVSVRLSFKYTGKENILSEIKVKTLGTRMIEKFYGHVTEKNPGNNPTFLQFSKRVATEASYFVIPVVTSGSTMCQNVSVSRTRDEVSSTYTMLL